MGCVYIVNGVHVDIGAIMASDKLKRFAKDSGLFINQDDLKQRVLSYLKRKRKPVTIVELSDKFDRSISTIRNVLDGLTNDGYSLNNKITYVELLEDVPINNEFFKIDTGKFKGQRLEFGVLADQHYCSKYSREDVCEALFDIWHERGIKYVLQCGNIIDGEARFNKHDLLVPPGIMNQVDYLIQRWPKREGMKTLFITGDDHEGWYQQREGIDVGKLIMQRAEELGRSDMIYLGYMERNLLFGNEEAPQVIRLMHAGGGTAYAISYTSQKIIESLQGGCKPHILLIGHYHKFDISYPRNVYTVQPGATQDQTPFLRKKKIESHIGGVTLGVTLGKDGLFHDITTSWHPFYDRDFYEKAWKYAPLSVFNPDKRDQLKSLGGKK